MAINESGNYLDINRESWDRRAVQHVQSEFYNQDAFLQGKNSLNKIELDLLESIQGKSVLHLQCHFGQDTLSLARLGATAVCGVDLSPEAIRIARETADKIQIPAQFICCDLYSLPEQLHNQYEIVFSSYGTIGWLPDIKRWAEIVSRFLKPGGIFVFAEFHPAMWMFDNALNAVQYSYFNSSCIDETEAATYTGQTEEKPFRSITWNHGLAEVMQALLDEGLQLEIFQEFDYSPYHISSRMEEFSPGRYRYAHLGNKLPLVYALRMRKPI